MNTKTYSELMSFKTFEERYRYLRCCATVGEDTFGYARHLNQAFYSSIEWKRFRRSIIIRDQGCDLGIEDRIISGQIILHHINPLTVDDLLHRRECLMDPENVICVSFNTHQAIHYGDENLLIHEPIERTMNDTCPWKH
jgi:hypothetical protein